MFLENTLSQLAQQSPWLIALLCFIFAALVGSFLNVVIYRLPVMMKRQWQQELAEYNGQAIPEFETFNLMVPGSHCGHCQTPIKPWHNLPIIGWFILRGQCASCHTPYSIRYPLIELLTALLSVAVLIHFDYSDWGMAAVVLTWLLISLTFIDFDHCLLPDSLTLPLLWAGLFVHLLIRPELLQSAIIGAMAGYLSLWSIYWGFKLLTGKEGMGYGDFKLLAALGAWLGWQYLPLVILLSSLVGAVLGIGLILVKGRDHQQPMPFGPYLAIAGWIALMWGESILTTYLGLLGY